MGKVLFVFVGIVLIAASASLGFATRSFMTRASGAEGVVVRLNAGGSHPQIEFKIASGERVSYPQGGLIWGYQAGDHVHVIYDASDPPRTARIKVFGALWFVPILLLGLGLAFITSGLFMKAGI